jgi:hypothetical protein
MKPSWEGAEEEVPSVVSVEEWILHESFGRIRDRNRLLESHLREHHRRC